jgi:hypothetical protein
LKATKGKTSAKEAGVMRRRDVALVLAVEQLRAQHGMSLDDACDRVATTTGRISPGTLVNTYAKLKRDGWVPELLGLVQHLFPRDEEELRAAYRDLGFRLCQDLDFALSLPMPPSILIERTCLNCDTLFTTSDRMIRLCPACQPRVPHL